MSLLETLLTAIALAMDAFTVSVASGLSARCFHLRHALTVGMWFGGFQAAMPILGWMSGVAVRRWVSSFDHWVAFLLLAFIGSRMIYESFKIKEARKIEELLAFNVLLGLAVATSLDAYAVGISLAMVRGGLLMPAAVTGAVTFLFSGAGVWLGGRKRFERLDNRAEAAGGIILLAIGIRILIQHVMTDGFF